MLGFQTEQHYSDFELGLTNVLNFEGINFVTFTYLACCLLFLFSGNQSCSFFVILFMSTVRDAYISAQVIDLEL